MGSVLVAVSVEPRSHVPTTLRTSKSAQKLAAASLDPPMKVRSNLYIGSRDTEMDLAALQAAGVTAVLQAGVELAPSHPEKFHYEQLACSDTETHDIVSHFQTAFAFIDEGRKRGVVLLHCAQGVSRSASILIGYLMAREQLSYEDALAQLQAARPQVQPNSGFALQLQEFGRNSCCLESWSSWSESRMDDCFAQVSVSRRREVRGLSAMIRHFHMADVGEEDTVFDSRSFLL